MLFPSEGTVNVITSALKDRLFPVWSGQEEQAIQIVLARKDTGWGSHARHRCAEGSKFWGASWKREKLELGLDVGSRLQVSEKSEVVSSIVQVGERNGK